MSEIVSRVVGAEDSSLQWDIYSQRASDVEVHIRDNKVESIRSPILSEGFAIRIVRAKGESSKSGMRSGIGIGPGTLIDRENEVRRSLNFALEASKVTSFPEYKLPQETLQPLPNVENADDKIKQDSPGSSKDLAEKVTSLLEAEQDIRVTFCKIRLTSIDTTLENCFGLHLEKNETFAYFEAGLSPSEEGSSGLSEYWPRVLARRVVDLGLEEDIPMWVKFARDSQRVKPPVTGEYSLITPPEVLSEMVPPIVSFHSSASTLRKGMSRWKDRGMQVWSDKITISDDGLFDYGLSTSPFDDEGNPQQKTEIIRNGEFRNYITNNMYADFVHGKSTGNAVKVARQTGSLCYADDISLGHTNIVMGGGDSSLEEMIKETKKGLLIEQFSWMDPDGLTGTFGAEIRHAYYVENGVIKHPIKGGVVNGSFFESEGSGGHKEKGIFDSLDLISRDLAVSRSTVLPSARFPTIRISGS